MKLPLLQSTEIQFNRPMSVQSQNLALVKKKTRHWCKFTEFLKLAGGGINIEWQWGYFNNNI